MFRLIDVDRQEAYDLNDAEEDKLRELATHRKKAPIECIRDFIATCQPGGTGWEPPEKANK